MRLSSTEGTWFPFNQDCEFLIRPIPSGLDKELYIKHFGRTQKIRRKKGMEIIDLDLEKTSALAIDRVTYALLESKNAEIPAISEEDVTFYGAVLVREIAKGDYFKLDGHWTPDVKARALPLLPNVVQFVVEKANQLIGKSREEEDEEGKD